MLLYLMTLWVCHVTASVKDSTLVGNLNLLGGESSNVQIVGSETQSYTSDDSTLLGHDARIEQSDESSVVGTEVHIDLSDSAVGIGHEVNITSSDQAVGIGSHLRIQSVPKQVVIGAYNAPTDAAFVAAGGTADDARQNLFEVKADGSLVNAHIVALTSRILALEGEVSTLANQMDALHASIQAALAGCGDPQCENLNVAFQVSGCCPT